jgi:hypothetical protein
MRISGRLLPLSHFSSRHYDEILESCDLDTGTWLMGELRFTVNVYNISRDEISGKGSIRIAP